MAELPSLMQVRQAHKLTSRQLADAAGVPLRVSFVAEIGGRVEEWEANLLLAALSKFTGKQYTLQNVQIHITKREQPVSEGKQEANESHWTRNERPAVRSQHQEGKRGSSS